MGEHAGTGTPTTGTGATGTDTNVVVVVGRVAGEVRCTELASGSTVRNLEVVADREGGERVPVAWYDARRPPAVVDGDAVVVVGRVRRRWFRAGGVSVSRTEVVASVVARAGSRRAESALARVAAKLAVVVGGGRLDDG